MAEICVDLWRIYGSHLGRGLQLQELRRKRIADEKYTVNLLPWVESQTLNLTAGMKYDVKYSRAETFCCLCPRSHPPSASLTFILTALSSLHHASQYLISSTLSPSVLQGVAQHRFSKRLEQYRR